MTDLPVLRTRYARRFARTLEQLGASAGPSLKHCNVDPRVIAVDDGYMPVRQLHRFLVHAVERTGVCTLGLESGINPRGQHSDFSREIASARTLTRSIETLVSNEKSEDTTAKFSLKRQGASIWLYCGGIEGPGEAVRQIECYRYAAVLEVIRYAAGPKWLPARIRFQHIDDGRLSTHHLLRKVGADFGATQLAIEIPEELFHHSLQSGAAMRRVSRRQAAGHLTAPLSFKDAIAELVRTNMLGGRCKLNYLAKTLEMPERSLQRKLAEHGLSFAGILQQARMESAWSMLAGESRLGDIAASLGYRHSTHFSRSFKRSCGVTPRQYRLQQ